MNQPVNDPFASTNDPQQTMPSEQSEMLQMQMQMRDKEHINLLAIFHYVWAGLIGLGAIGMIAHLFMMESMTRELMAMPVSAPTSVSSSPASGATPVSPSTLPAPVTPANPSTPAHPAHPASSPTTPPSVTTTTSGGSGSTTWSTTSTSGSMPAHAIDSMMRMMYIIYGTIAGLLLIGVICNIFSARFLQKKKHRVFSMVVGAINALMFPIGTVLGVFTFIVLCRQSMVQIYTPLDAFTQRDPR